MIGVSDRKMLCLLLFLCLATAKAATEKEISTDNEKEISKEDKVQCVKKFVEWCNGMQYPQEGRSSGIAVLSISYQDDTRFYRVFCSSDSDGTNCSRNGLPWFSCTPDHVLTYKGEVLTETTTDVDNEICKTQEKAFNEFFVQNMSYDNSTMIAMEKELKSFFKEILNMRQQIHEMTKRLGDASFMGDNFWKEFDGFPFNHGDEDTDTIETRDDEDTDTIETRNDQDTETIETRDEKKETNRIEKE